MPSRFRIRLWWVGYTTFVIRAFQDIVRYSILTIAPSAITTALYFAVFGELIGRRIGGVDGIEYRQYIAPGLIMMPVIATSYSQTALSFFTAKFHGILDEHLMSPQPGWMIVLSYVTGGLLRGFLVGSAAAIVVLLFARTHVQHAAAMAAGFLLVSLLTSLAGFVNAVFAKSFEQINGMISFVLVPLTYCGGVFFSISLLPGWARLLALANPVLYMVELFRWCMLGASDIHVGVAVCSMLVMSLILFAVATELTQRGVGIKE